MAADLETLSLELHLLRGLRDRLATALAICLVDLRESGAAPPSETIQAVRDYSRRYEEIERQIHANAALNSLAGTGSLDEWAAAVATAKRHQQLDQLFSEVRRLHFRGGEAPGPLARFHDEADEIHRRVFDGDDSLAEELLTGKHPLTSLLTLVREGDGLNDDDWTAHQDRIGSRYGRELSTAVARGKIQLRDSHATSEVLS